MFGEQKKPVRKTSPDSGFVADRQPGTSSSRGRQSVIRTGRANPNIFL
jgi:hypothetical protein